MSVETMAIVLHHSKAKGTAKLVLIGIANHDGDGGAWPSIKTLAGYAGVDERTVQRHLKALVELGEVSIEIKQGGDRKTPDWARPNRYDVLVRCPKGCDGTKNHRVAPVSPGDASVTTPGDVSVTTPGDVSVTTPGDVSVTTPVTPVSPEPSLEPSLEPPLEPSTTNTGRSASKQRPIPEGWEPTESHRVKAKERGLDLAAVAEDFKLYFEAKGTQHVDWDKAFHRWLNNTRPTQRNGAAQSGDEFSNMVARALNLQGGLQ